MANVFDYLDWRGDLDFGASRFCEVDAHVLSLLSYLSFDGIVPEVGAVPFSSAAREFLARYEKTEQKEKGTRLKIISLLSRAAKTKRFSSLSVGRCASRTEESAQMQFAAISFFCENGDTFVCFRGTDDSLVGWKENLNMSFLASVPAQTEAVSYLESVVAAGTGRVYLCGHSKGGNLAFYAAVMSAPAVRERIERAYNLDGPGFSHDFLKRAEYAQMRSKLFLIVPQDSVVGLLLEQSGEYAVIATDRSGILAHDGFSWQVLGERFLRRAALSESSVRVDRLIGELIESMSPAERERFAGALYEAALATGAQNLSDFRDNSLSLLELWARLPIESREVLFRAIKFWVKNGNG